MRARGARQRRSGARALRTAAWIVGGLVGTVLLLSLGVPLMVRGKVLGRMVEQAATHVCGSVTLAGGHIDLGLVPALIFQRPLDVALDGVHIREPDGNDLFHADTVRTTLAVRRHPWRVVVDRALIANGAWRLVDKGLGEPITQALARIPPGGRAECAHPRASPPGPQPSPGPKLAVRGLELRNVTVLLSFPSWGVRVDGVNARGTVDVLRTSRGIQLLFDARDVESSRGGKLTVGPRRAPLTPVVPFDRVSIPRVAVTPDAPHDVLLVVKEATTGAAVLSGRSVFTDVLLPRAVRRLVRPGMVLDARWTELGQALRRSVGWATVGQRLAPLRAGVRASLRGPFGALIGSMRVAGHGAAVEARLLPHRRYTLDLAFDALDTTPWLPPGRRAQLGGQLDGRVSVSARRGRRLADLAVSLDTVELALARAGAGDRLPRRWVVSRAFRPRAPDELRVDLGEVALANGVLGVELLRIDAPAVTWAGRLRGERPAGSRAFLVRAWSAPGSRVTVGSETFLPPSLLAVRVDPGRSISVDRFSVGHVGGGRIDAGGTVRAHGALDLSTAIHAYPLAHLPGLSGARAIGRSGSLADVLRGRVDASFAVTGRAREPSLSGTLALSDVRWAEHALGGGHVTFDAIPDGTLFQGPVVEGVGVRGRLHLRPRGQDFAAVTLRDFSLAPWSPRAAAPLGLRATGETVWRPGAGGTPASTTADLAVRGPGIAVNATARLARDPRTGDALSAAWRGRVSGAALGPWLHGGGHGAGTLQLEGRVAGSIGAPRVQGQARFEGFALGWPRSPFETIRLDGPLAIDGRTVSVGPLLGRFGRRGWVRVAGPAGRGSGRVVLAASGAPLPVSQVDLTVRAADLNTTRPIAGLTLRGPSLALQVTETEERTLRVVGDVHLGHDLFQLVRGGHGGGKPAGPQPERGPTLADRVWVHLRLTGPDDAVTVGVPHIPDVTIGVRCLVEGPLTAPRIVGQVKGDGLYSRAALAVADWFSARKLRACDLGPVPQSDVRRISRSKGRGP
jgi:hypothetical protein